VAAHTRAITGKRTLPAERSSLLLMDADLDKFSSSEEDSQSEESESEESESEESESESYESGKWQCQGVYVY